VARSGAISLVDECTALHTRSKMMSYRNCHKDTCNSIAKGAALTHLVCRAGRHGAIATASGGTRLAVPLMCAVWLLPAGGHTEPRSD
jgi:hypothetical protein